ncbi:hypothetical protein FI667_g7421, partial [Globisporangium splendens]
MAAAVDAVEDSFLRGEWAAALAQSKEKLTQSIVQVSVNVHKKMGFLRCHQTIFGNGAGTTLLHRERLLSVYLQSVFELEQYDEVETAAVIVQSFERLSFEVEMQWIKFLLAMNRSGAALERINDMRLRYLCLLRETNNDALLLSLEYKRILELLVFQILLPSESIDSVRKTIYSDGILDEVSKQHMLERVDAFVSERVRSSAASASSSSVRNASAQSPQIAHGTHASASATTTITTSSRSATSKPSHLRAQSDDDSSTYVMIGGAALALTFAAIGAIRYKDRLHEAVEGVVPAISKGLSDAKYALFDA